MKTTKIGVIVTVLAIYFAAVIMIALPIDGKDTSKNILGNQSEIVDFTTLNDVELEVILFAEDNNAKYSFAVDSAIDVEVIENYFEPASGEIIYLDGDWLREDSKTSTSRLNSLIDNGNPVILIDNDMSLITDGDVFSKTKAFYEDSDAYCIYYNAGQNIVSCYSISNPDPEKVLIATYNWANYALTTTATGSVDDIDLFGGDFGTITEAFGDKVCGDFGNMSIRTKYIEILYGSTSESCFLTHYVVQVDPEGKGRNCGFNIKNELTYWMGSHPVELEDYSPTTSVGTTTETVDLSVSTDISISLGMSWSYAKDDVTTVDNSSMMNKRFELFHSIDPGSDAGSNTYLGKPGMLISADKVGSYSYFEGVDQYRAEFKKHVFLNIFNNLKTFDYNVYVYIFNDN